MRNKSHPLHFFGSLVIDYIRWSQLAPMIMMWLFAALMIFMLYFVNHQDETVDGAAAVIGWVAELPVIGPSFIEWMEKHATDDDVIHLGGTDFKGAAMKIWMFLSLAMMVVGWVANLIFGPFQPLTLKRKLGFAGLGSLAFMAGFFGVYFLDPEAFNATPTQLAVNSVGIALLLFLVSVWCLSIAHMLSLVGRSPTTTQTSKASPENELRIDTH